jgi:pimeloyl-ACP methyl ester carboxylesterase
VWFPGRISGLVLIDAVGLYLPDARILDIFLADMNDAMMAANPHGHDVVSPLMLGLEGDDDGTALITHMMRAQQVAAQLGWSPYMHDPKLESRLGSIDVPTLVLWGADDGVVPRAHGERYAERIPDAKLVIVPEVGHLPVLETPEEIADLISDFFA